MTEVPAYLAELAPKKKVGLEQSGTFFFGNYHFVADALNIHKGW